MSRWREDTTGKWINVHDQQNCLPPCPIHQPSDHHMVSWDRLYRFDREIMERICEHGIGHPDPDDLRVRTARDSGIHGCDGCCIPPWRNPHREQGSRPKGTVGVDQKPF